jgi:hypothetical protein
MIHSVHSLALHQPQILLLHLLLRALMGILLLPSFLPMVLQRRLVHRRHPSLWQMQHRPKLLRASRWAAIPLVLLRPKLTLQ